MNVQVKTKKVYDEVIDFIAGGTTPESVIAFQLSETSKERLQDLIEGTKTEGLSPEEREELEMFLVLEHIMRMAKAKARIQIQSKSE